MNVFFLSFMNIQESQLIKELYLKSHLRQILIKIELTLKKMSFIFVKFFNGILTINFLFNFIKNRLKYVNDVLK